MAEGELPKPKIPTTPEQLTGPEGIWDEYFGDVEEQQYMLSDIRQRHASVLEQDGEVFFLLKRRQSGTKCPYWSDESGSCSKPLDSQASCYNTKWIGGYHQPIEIKVGLPSAGRKNLAEDAGLLKLQEMRAWTLWTPELTDRDMLVRSKTGERFEVQQVEETGPWRGLIVAQFFTVEPLQIGTDYGYNVDVPMLNR